MKISHKYRIICLLLALLAVFAFGCAEKTDIIEDSSAESVPPVTESQQPEGWIDSLEDVGNKYSDREFRIITSSEALFRASGSDVLLGKAVGKRNDLVSGKYGITFDVLEQSSSEIRAGLKQAASNGEKYADLICAPADVLAQLANEGLLENLYSLPCIDFDAGYMPVDEMKEQSVGSTMYMFTGSLTMATNECLTLFYNKKLVHQQGIDVVELVNNNEWTWSAFNALLSEISKSAKDGIATTLTNEQLMMAIYNSSGNKLVLAEDNANVAYDNETAALTKRIMSEIFENPTLCPSYTTEAIEKAFLAGDLAFILGRMSDVLLVDDAKSEWGVLPLPKHSEEQLEYCTPITSSAAAIAVPKNNGDSAFVGTILNALFAASSDTLEEAQRLTYVNYYFWSNDSSVMLYRMSKSKIYDIGNIYSDIPAVANIGKNLLALTEATTPSAEAKEAFRKFAEKIFF